MKTDNQETNIYNYMKTTTREVARNGIIPYIREYSPEIAPILEANLYLPFIRATRQRGTAKPKIKDRASLLCSQGRAIYECIREDWQSIIPFLSAAEIFLSSTYVIDDIADNQELRFGHDASWRKFGRNEAIFSGFRLREIAEKIILEKQQASSDVKLELVSMLSDTSLKTYEGQTLNDLLISKFDEQVYKKRCQDFGSVFVGFVGKGASLLTKASEVTKTLIGSIADLYGEAIMIRNDLKDYLTSQQIDKFYPSSIALRRTPLEDFRIGRITYPLHCALDNPEYSSILTNLLGRSDLSPSEEAEIASIMEKSGAFEETAKLIASMRMQAEEKALLLPDNPGRSRILSLLSLMRNSDEYARNIKCE